MTDNIEDRRMNYKKHIPTMLCILAAQSAAIVLKVNALVIAFMLAASILFFTSLFHKMTRTGKDTMWGLMDYPYDVFEQICLFYAVSLFLGLMLTEVIIWYVNLWKSSPVH